MKRRTRTIQALACATIAGILWDIWDIVSFARFTASYSAEQLDRWVYFGIGCDALVSVLAGVVAIRALLKFRKLRPLCWLTVVLLIVNLCIFDWRWFFRVLGNLQMLAPQWIDLLFVLDYVVPLALLTLRLSGKSDSRDESGSGEETLDAETKTRYAILYAFLVPVSIGLWIGAGLLWTSRLGGGGFLALGLGLGIVWARWLGRRAGGARTGLIPRLSAAFVRAIADLFAGVKALFVGIKHIFFDPLPLGWGLVWKTLAGLMFAMSVVIAIGLLSDASEADYRSAKTVLQLAAFEWAFGGLVGAAHLWAIGGSLFSNILVTRQNLARIRFANGHGSEGKGIPQTGGMYTPPPGGEPNRLGGWVFACRIVAAICLGLVLPVCIVALFSEDSDVVKAGVIGIPCIIVAFFWWKTWAEIFREQDEASVEARAQERWMTASNPAIFGAEPESSSGRVVNPLHKRDADAVRGLLGLEAVALFALVVYGVWLFWTLATLANAIAAEQRAYDQAHQVALVWRSESKTISISDSVSIDLQSVPGNLWFGKYEVTQAQWEAVMGENPSRFKGAEHPVETVSWDDCQEFLKKLNALPSVKKKGLTFRLPTDAEWEAACRAGATGDYCLLSDGTEITKDTLGLVAWFEDNADSKTHPVGQKKPNAFGLYDMHGNVWEWCQEELGTVASWAKGKSYEHDRVDRGGSWYGWAGFCESSFRRWNSPVDRFHTLGFRLCASGKAD